VTTVELPVRPIGRPTGWWGMLFVVITEATLFAILLATYFYTRFRSPGPWPPDGEPDPRLLKPVIMTLLLMASSVTVYVAELGSRAGNRRRLHAGLAATFALGLSFLILQGFEYHEKLAELRPSTNAYGSLFYTITNLHALHLVIGMAFLVFCIVRILQGKVRPGRHDALSVSVLYWHFVDAVWIAVFSILYLSVSL
jgi:cytochrome c oxidase subunit III